MLPPVPRRLSVADADYDPIVGAHLLVLLDGVDQNGRAESYDLDAGTVTRAKLNNRGLIYVDGDEIAMETVAGAVEVTWNPTAGFQAACLAAYLAA